MKNNGDVSSTWGGDGMEGARLIQRVHRIRGIIGDDHGALHVQEGISDMSRATGRTRASHACICDLSNCAWVVLEDRI